MMIIKARKLLVGLLGVLCAACASAPAQPPAWIMAPSSDRGFAATDCVKSSGNLSMERQMATARARADIAKQIEVRVAAMDKTYARIADQGGLQPATAQTSFESVSKQIAEQNLASSLVTRAEYVELASGQNLCVMVEVDAPKAKKIYEQIVQAAVAQGGSQPDAASNEVLYREFVGIK